MPLCPEQSLVDGSQGVGLACTPTNAYQRLEEKSGKYRGMGIVRPMLLLRLQKMGIGPHGILNSIVPASLTRGRRPPRDCLTVVSAQLGGGKDGD
jgi:hypothetical protein